MESYREEVEMERGGERGEGEGWEEVGYKYFIGGSLENKRGEEGMHFYI